MNTRGSTQLRDILDTLVRLQESRIIIPPVRFEKFEAAIVELPEVLECSIVTGQAADFLLKVVVRDMQHYEQFLLGQLTRLDGVTGVHSSFVLREVLKKTA